MAALAVTSGYIVVLNPHLFSQVLFLDIWLLGFHHVISTFTRLAFDAKSARENWFLVFVLPWVILAGSGGMIYFFGLWSIASLYFYWQWFHYTRQSYGIFRAFERKSGSMGLLESRVTSAALYLVPLFGIAWRSYENPGRFLGMQLFCIPITLPVLTIIGLAAVTFLGWWAILEARAWRQGNPRPILVMYLLSHFAVFYIGYYAITSIDTGWLVLNVWHNAQYIMFVWWFNQNRFKSGIDPQHRFLSWLSQPRWLNIVSYFAVCLAISTAFYAVIGGVLRVDFFTAIPVAAVVIYQSINFHHYVVDGIIWKRRRSAKKPSLPLPGSSTTFETH
ncbi:hypothetical protein [Stratiformator vulcanicus]|uniref:hypothetical protein n=1 Tax=Stratiformator vulcanicus TaxID=2527980 RepID=UPI0011A6840A|nr:hypothetical protein [Stratiformator vulcanicus]